MTRCNSFKLQVHLSILVIVVGVLCNQVRCFITQHLQFLKVRVKLAINVLQLSQLQACSDVRQYSLTCEM